jgi:hypothetical protein
MEKNTHIEHTQVQAPEADEVKTTPEVVAARLDTQKENPFEATEQEQIASGEIKPKRTFGNKLFDLAVYPGVAFGAVFLASVAVINNAKNGKGALNRLHRSSVEFFSKRMPKETAKATRDAAESNTDIWISFATGTLFMPVIKIFEDNRQRISRKLDQWFDTEPDDARSYGREPEQSWLSVLAGRAGAFLVVWGLAKFAGRPIDRSVKDMTEGGGWVSKEASKSMTPDNLEKAKGWWYSTTFEGLWTALCTVLLYGFSRTLAGVMGNGKQEPQELPPVPTQATEGSALAEVASETFNALEEVPGPLSAIEEQVEMVQDEIFPDSEPENLVQTQTMAAVEKVKELSETGLAHESTA